MRLRARFAFRAAPKTPSPTKSRRHMGPWACAAEPERRVSSVLPHFLPLMPLLQTPGARDRTSSEIRLHGVDPQTYFTDVITKLVNLWPASRLDELMPWAWAAERSHSRCGCRSDGHRRPAELTGDPA